MRMSEGRGRDTEWGGRRGSSHFALQFYLVHYYGILVGVGIVPATTLRKSLCHTSLIVYGYRLRFLYDKEQNRGVCTAKLQPFESTVGRI